MTTKTNRLVVALSLIRIYARRLRGHWAYPVGAFMISLLFEDVREVYSVLGANVLTILNAPDTTAGKWIIVLLAISLIVWGVWRSGRKTSIAVYDMATAIDASSALSRLIATRYVNDKALAKITVWLARAWRDLLEYQLFIDRLRRSENVFIITAPDANKLAISARQAASQAEIGLYGSSNIADVPTFPGVNPPANWGPGQTMLSAKPFDPTTNQNFIAVHSDYYDQLYVKLKTLDDDLLKRLGATGAIGMEIQKAMEVFDAHR